VSGEGKVGRRQGLVEKREGAGIKEGVLRGGLQYVCRLFKI